MSTVTTQEPPRPHPAVETAFLAPEVVLWDGRHQRVHHFNPSASAVWLFVDGKLTADQIATELSEIFETPQDAIRPDVDDALAEFLRLGLLDDNAGLAGDASQAAADDHQHHDHQHHDHQHQTAHTDDLAERAAHVDEVAVVPRPPDP